MHRISTLSECRADLDRIQENVLSDTFVEVRLTVLLQLLDELDGLRQGAAQDNGAIAIAPGAPVAETIGRVTVVDAKLRSGPGQKKVSEPPAAGVGEEMTNAIIDRDWATLQRELLDRQGVVKPFNGGASASTIEDVLQVVSCAVRATELNPKVIAAETGVLLPSVSAILYRRADVIARGRIIVNREHQREYLRLFGLQLRFDASAQKELAKIRGAVAA